MFRRIGGGRGGDLGSRRAAGDGENRPASTWSAPRRAGEKDTTRAVDDGGVGAGREGNEIIIIIISLTIIVVVIVIVIVIVIKRSSMGIRRYDNMRVGGGG